MFRKILPFLILLLTLLLDQTILPVFVEHWALPSFLFCSIIVLGLLLGRTRGLLYGLIGGLLTDVLVATPLGLLTLIYAGCGYLSGIAGRRFQRYVLTVAVTPLLCLLIREAGLAFYAYLAGQFLNNQTLSQALMRVGIETVLCQFIYLLYNVMLRPKWSRYAA